MHVYMYISVFESYYDVMYIICRGEWSCCKAGISGPCINRQWHCYVDEGDVLVELIGLFLVGGGGGGDPCNRGIIITFFCLYVVFWPLKL